MLNIFSMNLFSLRGSPDLWVVSLNSDPTISEVFAVFVALGNEVWCGVFCKIWVDVHQIISFQLLGQGVGLGSVSGRQCLS